MYKTKWLLEWINATQKVGKCWLIPATRHINMISGCRYYLVLNPFNYLGLIDDKVIWNIEGFRKSSPKNLRTLLKCMDILANTRGIKTAEYIYRISDEDKRCFIKEGYIASEGVVYQTFTHLRKQYA